MEETTHQSFDRFGSIPSSGERIVDSQNVTEKPISPKDERNVTAHPSPDAAISGSVSGSSRIAKDQSNSIEKTGGSTTVNQPDVSHEQGAHLGGYDRWDEQSNYVNANSLHVIPPAMYNENLFFPPYGYDSTQMAYGQFPAMPSPLSPIMFDGQLYSPHQFPVSPPYFPPSISPGLPRVSSALAVSQADMMASANSGQENLADSFFGPGSGYYVPFGSFGGGDLSGNSSLGFYKFPGEFGSSEQLSNQSNSLDPSRYLPPLTSGPMYPQPMGILGPYEQSVMQQATFQGVGYTSNSLARQFPTVDSYQGSKYGGGSYTRWDSNHRNRLNADKGGRRDRERDSISYSTESLGISSDRNRGPRASKPKNKNPNEDNSSTVNKDAESISALQFDQYNRPEFSVEYENAKFFIIKSFSEDNVHKSIKYGVWSSTVMGNRKLDAAYHEAKKMAAPCPIFLFFSVNASGQFCGIAEMVGPVDFENDAEYWQQDRWTGQFPVKWLLIKDVPNTQFRHILLDNNDNKPVTHSRDSQEVKLGLGIEMLKIFKEYETDTSLLEDFTFYDEREKALLEKKAKHRASFTEKPAVSFPVADVINQLSDNLADTLHLESSKTPPVTQE